MTSQEYCSIVHTGLCSYSICYDGLSVTGGLFFFAALMYFDISCDILSKWFSSVLVCIVIV